MESKGCKTTFLNCDLLKANNTNVSLERITIGYQNTSMLWGFMEGESLFPVNISCIPIAILQYYAVILVPTCHSMCGTPNPYQRFEWPLSGRCCLTNPCV